MKPRILGDSGLFTTEFARCCREYHSVTMASAWCGDPARLLPFRHLEKLDGQITATLGVSFNDTHPDAISWLLASGADVTIYNEALGLFHPKVYLFQKAEKCALFVGSSNFTHAGFYTNTELNILLEGEGDEEVFSKTLVKLSAWHSDPCSFVPDAAWLEQYRAAYRETRNKAKREALRTPPDTDAVAPGNFLATAEWEAFYAEVTSRLKQEKRNAQGYHDVLDAAARLLPLPWQTSNFETLEQRRVLGGLGKYGWLGHIAANGRLRGLLANGSRSDLRTLVNSINEAATLSTPLDWVKLKRSLINLERLGFTMKTWGRLLALARPDLYCTVSAESVRENLSGVLGIPRNHFQRSEGYIRMLKLVHQSPWFQSQKPINPAEAAVWDRRVAFIDPIYYRGRNPT